VLAVAEWTGVRGVVTGDRLPEMNLSRIVQLVRYDLYCFMGKVKGCHLYIARAMLVHASHITLSHPPVNPS
jgi:hypothetical protein